MKPFDVKKEFFIIIFIFIIAVILSLDLFLHTGRPTTFDGPTHITNIAQTYKGLMEGEFPVRWGDGFARYGLPAPMIAQQVPSYMGAIITIATQDVVSSYNLTVVISAFLATFLLYYFLRLYISPISALSGAFLFNFAPYRIMNIYIRGALPEFFASVFILLILISIYYAIEKEKSWSYILMTIAIALLLLTHPFMVVVSSILFIPYGVWILLKKENRIKKIIGVTVAGGFAIGLTAYYLFPLFIEIRYFNYGTSLDHFSEGHFLSLRHFFVEEWFYMKNDTGPREHWHLGGIFETSILIIASIFTVWRYVKIKKIDLITILSGVGIIYVLFTLPITEFIYKNIIFLGNIQHPWRMLTGFILVPPILLGFLIEKTDKKIWFLIITIIIVAILRFPQLYGKNYTDYPQQSYFLTDYNLHGHFMNTVWMGKERDYPYQNTKVHIIEGEGTITESVVHNSSRAYTVEAQTDIRMVDYTFYFPGWKVYVDGVETPIQFQDPNYRGVITYNVPAGNHKVRLKFEETKIRIFGNAVSIAAMIGVISIYYINRRYKFV
ncbi:MAG TPA: 6-pyruvoyl-tetrahydropterin synthase-related protein [Candidatus Woesebacteria bacterium]|nr:6-pyruvoyl-tetrahydropterin synthase-related protein [Candidatus Woesebacteria bacterium]